MQRIYQRINWENEPSTKSPINESNLNSMDSAIYEIDGRVVNQDTTKANQSDLLLALKTIDFNETTGLFTFTWFNGTKKTVDLNIEKIPTAFSMSDAGVITMTNTDGTKYTADVSKLIKTYAFNDSSEIDFTTATDANGNKTITAKIVSGSITGDKLQPNYLADVTTQAAAASTSATAAADSATLAESYAKGSTGTRTGEDTDNAKYYSEQSQALAAAEANKARAWAIGPGGSGEATADNNAKKYAEDAKAYAENAASVVGIGIATTTTPGLVRPDGETITIDSTGLIQAQSGHEILDKDGGSVAQKKKLQFLNSNVVNDGDVTKVTPNGGVTAVDPTTPQTTETVTTVTAFNGRSGAVSPATGDYTAAMVGALPTQKGTKGQLLGFTANNTVGAVAAPSAATISKTGLVKPDGTTITVDSDGTIHGVAEVDTSTLLHKDGSVTANYLTIGTRDASGSGGSYPASIGISSFSNGSNLIANGVNSHAEGTNSMALGDNSHAEGYAGLAGAMNSHAEGYATTVNGNSAHAEGFETQANGHYSHSGGMYAKSSGQASFAHGNSPVASGTNSFAIGFGNKATGNNAVATGQYTLASGAYSHTEGTALYSSSASLSGTVTGVNGSKTWTANDSLKNALASYTQVQQGVAVKLSSGSTYFYPIAANNDGVLTLSTALTDSGQTTGASITLDAYCILSGMATAAGSHIEGTSCSATATYAHAEGNQSKAKGVSSHAEGQSSETNGVASHAEGRSTTADGNYSHAEGYSSRATANYSHSEGRSTNALGEASHAEGYGTTAGVDANYAHAEGYMSEAGGKYSHAGGWYNIANYDGQTAIGKFNDNKEGNLFEIGNGTSDTSRSNALTVDSSGNLMIAGNLLLGTTLFPKYVDYVLFQSAAEITFTKTQQVIATIDVTQGLWLLTFNIQMSTTGISSYDILEVIVMENSIPGVAIIQSMYIEPNQSNVYFSGVGLLGLTENETGKLTIDAKVRILKNSSGVKTKATTLVGYRIGTLAPDPE